MERKFRPTIELPVELAEQMENIADQRGVTRAMVCHHLLVTAAQAVLNGYGALLPRAERAARGSLGSVVQVRWSQAKRDYNECAALIVSAGSSPTAVLREGGALYVDADGDLLRMPWLRPPSGGSAPAR